MANQPASTGRAGVAPSLEDEQRCPACSADLPCLRHHALRTAPASGTVVPDEELHDPHADTAPDRAVASVGLAPSLERCTQCGYWVDELDIPKQPEDCINDHCPYCISSTQDVPDALLPWLRGVVAYARRQS